MPTYLYECQKCGKVIEAFQKMTDEHLEFHWETHLTKDKEIDGCYPLQPYCNGKVKRLIGKGSGIIFKGTGFWETDGKRKRGKPDDGEK